MKPSTHFPTKHTVLILLSFALLIPISGCPWFSTPPTAAFTAAPVSGALPLEVAFTDASDKGSADITGWAWDFGDGATSAAQNPAHTYNTAGSFTVSLTVTTSAGSGTETKAAFITVGKGTPVVTAWPAASAIAYGQTLADSVLTGGAASVEGSFAFDAPETSPEVGTYTAAATFTPADTANYNTVAGTVEVMVNKASPVISEWPAASAIAYGQTLADSALTGGTASVEGSFAFDAPATSPDAGTYTAAVTFTPADTANYNTVAGTVEVVVNKAAPVISEWPAASAITVGQTIADSALTGGTASVEGSFSFDAPETAPSTGTYAAAVTFLPADTEHYVSVGGIVNVRVNPVVGAVWYVAPEGTGSGTSWADAFGSIQAAVDAASADGGGEVWVAAGVYTTTFEPVVTMAQNVHLYGGFTGAETSQNARRVTIHKTIIDGQKVRRCVDGADNATLDGFFIVNGFNFMAGGMYNETCSPKIANCTFFGNRAHTGGAMINGLGAPQITNCIFAENMSEYVGGAMYNAAGSVVVANCVFFGNTTNYGGGAIGNAGGTPTVVNCILWDNVAINAPEIADLSSNPPSVGTASFSCVKGGCNGIGNLSSDPHLIGTLGSNGHVRPDSPCIDAGTTEGAPGTDIRGVLRPQGIGIDIGAYELDDSDNDTVSDNWEFEYFGNLTEVSALSDVDADSAPDIDESLHDGNPTVGDSDGDGVFDNVEIANGWDTNAISGIRRVSAMNTSGIEDGLSWATAYTSIQAAVDSLNDGEVWVAAGTYTATGDTVVCMKSHVNLFGGFSGAETERSARDPEVNATRIDGESTRCCILGANKTVLDGFIVAAGHSAYSSGGLYCYLESPLISDCIFTGNTSGGGGAMSFIACMTVRISDCLFTGNAATYSGGGVEYYASPLIFTDCQFVDNDAGIGGGAMNGNDSDPVVIGCSFEGNTASGGGGVAFTDSRPNMINCRFDGNTAENSGGGMANNGGFNVLMNCTFANNSSIANGSAISNYMCSCSIINCILWENSTGPNTEVLLFENYWNDPHYVLTVAYSCIQGGWEGAGNIDADPLFADPANGDYRLQAGSPCIDAGTAGGAPGTDLLGVTRPQGLGFDMGAYEYASR